MEKTSSIIKGYLALGGLFILSIVLGAGAVQTLEGIIRGIGTITSHHGLLGSDVLAISPFAGAGFVHAGLLGILALSVLYLCGRELDGEALAAALMVYGYGLYGKTLVNIWPLMAGVFLRVIIKKKSLAQRAPLALFATALGPLVSAVALYLPGADIGIGTTTLAIILGVSAGWVVELISTITPKLHRGLIVYNAGLAAGLVGVVINGIFLSAGVSWQKVGGESVLHSGDQGYILWHMLILAAYLILMGKRLMGRKDPSLVLLGQGMRQVAFLMVPGLCYVFFLPYAKLNGESLAAIFTVAAFGGMGLCWKHTWPLMVGVIIMACIAGGLEGLNMGQGFFWGALQRVCRRDMIFAAMAAQGMGPVTEQYGKWQGLLAGACHALVVPSIKPLHGSLLVYNHGFCTGILMTCYAPILERIGRKRDGLS